MDAANTAFDDLEKLKTTSRHTTSEHELQLKANWDQLHVAQVAFRDSRLRDVDGAITLVKVWTAATEVQDATSLAKFHVRRSQQQIMLSVLMMALWLADVETWLDERGGLSEPRPHSTWLPRLYAKMSKAFGVARSTTSEWDRAEYFAFPKGKHAGRPIQTYGQAGYWVGQDLHRLVHTRIMETLRVWFGFPQTESTKEMRSGWRNWDVQAEYVRRLLRAAGTPDVLLFETVWKGFNHVRLQILGVPNGSRVTPNHWTAFQAYLDDLLPRTITEDRRLAHASVSLMGQVCQQACKVDVISPIELTPPLPLVPEGLAHLVPFSTQRDLAAAASIILFLKAFKLDDDEWGEDDGDQHDEEEGGDEVDRPG